jgi:hypothetical protein
MSESIIPQKSTRRSGSPLGSGKCWVPVRNYPFRHEIHVSDVEFKVAVIWLDRTAKTPDRPRKLKTVLGGVRQRNLARKLIEKKVLVKSGTGYVLARECREHLTYYRDREA